jgi:DNA-binding NarL/FixJ family response regulator
LWRIKRLQLSSTRDPDRKEYLRRQVRRLEAMEKAPFDIIISDINMPRGHPTGIQFVEYLKRNYPNQKILIHSDDTENIERLVRQHGVGAVHKLGGNPVEDLKDELRRELNLKRIKKPKGKPKFIRATIRGP